MVVSILAVFGRKYNDKNLVVIAPTLFYFISKIDYVVKAYFSMKPAKKSLDSLAGK